MILYSNIFPHSTHDLITKHPELASQATSSKMMYMCLHVMKPHNFHSTAPWLTKRWDFYTCVPQESKPCTINGNIRKKSIWTCTRYLVWIKISSCVKMNRHSKIIIYGQVVIIKIYTSAHKNVNSCRRKQPGWFPMVVIDHLMMPSSNEKTTTGQSPLNSQHEGQWRGALMFSLIYAWNKQLNKQSWSWSFETPSHSLWRQCNATWW